MKRKSLLTYIPFVLLGGTSFAASLTVDESLAQSNIGAEAAGSRGDLVLDPAGVLGWANFDRASLTPSAGESGGVVGITTSQVGSFTLSVSTDNRFSQSWSGGSDTIGVRGQTGTGLAVGEGFRFSLVPGEIGSYTLMVHIADFNVDLDYAVTEGGNEVGSGELSNFGAASTYDEGPVFFHFTVDDAAEAVATWDFEITRSSTGGGNALLIGGVSLSATSTEENQTLVVDPAFSFVNYLTPQSFQIPFSNGGSLGSLVIASVTPGGADAADFVVDTVSSPVGVGGSGMIGLTFSPGDGVRDYQATFSIESNDVISSPTVVSLVVSVLPPPSLNLGKVICIGDSITEGRATRPEGDGNWSWRPWFWENLIDFSIGYEFVGTRTANRDGASIYPLYQGQVFENRHEAIWGTTFLERSNNVAGYLDSLKVNGKTPDTAVIFGGGNDIPLDRSVSAATVSDRTKVLVDHLQGDLGTAGNPKVRILLISILPRYTGSNFDVPDARNARYREINDLLKTLANNEITATSEVLFLDLDPFFANPPSLLYDGVHPNGSGEQLIGNAVFAALVPDMPAIQMRIESVDELNNQVNFRVRTHGPRTVRIQSSPDLSVGSWAEAVPSQVNPGEWVPMNFTGSVALPERLFLRAIAE